MSEAQFTRLFDFSAGIRNSDENPLAYPTNALLDGENVEIVGKALKTRSGTQLVGNIVPSEFWEKIHILNGEDQLDNLTLLDWEYEEFAYNGTVSFRPLADNLEFQFGNGDMPFWFDFGYAVFIDAIAPPDFEGYLRGDDLFVEGNIYICHNSYDTSGWTPEAIAAALPPSGEDWGDYWTVRPELGWAIYEEYVQLNGYHYRATSTEDTSGKTQEQLDAMYPPPEASAWRYYWEEWWPYWTSDEYGWWPDKQIPAVLWEQTDGTNTIRVTATLIPQRVPGPFSRNNIEFEFYVKNGLDECSMKWYTFTIDSNATGEGVNHYLKVRFQRIGNTVLCYASREDEFAEAWIENTLGPQELTVPMPNISSGARFLFDQSNDFGSIEHREIQVWLGTPQNASIRCIEQVYFPKAQQSYLLVQCTTDAQSVLCASNDQLPITDGTAIFEEVYSLGASAGVISVAQINDRALVTEGVAGPPLVFLGCMDEECSDWATPKNVLVESAGEDIYWDATSEVSDPDSTTSVQLSLLPIDGGIYICTDVPTLSAFYFEVSAETPNTAALSLYWLSSGEWDGGSVVDNTDGFNESGTVTFAEQATEYATISELTGYWWKVDFNAPLSASTLLSSVRFYAGTQALQNIGYGGGVAPMCFLYHDASTNAVTDMTVDVSDFTRPTYKFLNDGDRLAPTPMGSGDAIYIGYPTRFNAVSLFFADNYNNKETAALAVTYSTVDGWNGFISGFEDGTDSSGVTFSQDGAVTWSVGTAAWRPIRPFGGLYPIGYYVKLTVNADVSDYVGISECRVSPVEDALKKHTLVGLKGDRVVLLNRPEAPDQLEISRTLEEYGWSGADTWAARLGGPIIAYAEVFNQPFVWTPQELWLLNGYDTSTFALERAECAGLVPCAQQAVVQAPISEANGLNKQGVFFINQQGAWTFSGLQAYCISGAVGWWDENNTPHIDLDLLHLASGMYDTRTNRVMWAVPMVRDEAVTTNTHIIAFDLNLGAWLPPYALAVGTLCAAKAYNANAPGTLGRDLILAGDYNGNVVQLFGATAVSDLGVTIDGWAETGWLSFDQPGLRKQLRTVEVFGNTDSDVVITVYKDGNETAVATYTLEQLSGLTGRLFNLEEQSINVSGQFFKFKLAWSGGTIYGLEIQWQLLGVRQGQGVTA